MSEETFSNVKMESLWNRIKRDLELKYELQEEEDDDDDDDRNGSNTSHEEDKNRTIMESVRMASIRRRRKEVDAFEQKKRLDHERIKCLEMEKLNQTELKTNENLRKYQTYQCL